VVVLLLLLVGCKGIQTPAEKSARQDAAGLASVYRPDGWKPALPTLSTNSTLRDLLTFAMFNQPKVEAAYYDLAASVERITTARSLPDPQLTFQMDIQNIVTSVMPGFMANFPGPGKLRAAGGVAAAESEAKYFAFESRVLEAAADVKRAYYELHFLDQKIRVDRQTLDLLSSLEQLARSQNEVGKVTLQDILRAQIEEDRVKTEIANLEDSRQSRVARLKAALGLRHEEPDPPATYASFEPTTLDLTAETLLATALARNPRLKAMEAEVQAAQAAIELAYKARRPDFSLGLMADVKMNPFLYRPLATVSLPIWRDKIEAQIAEGQAMKRSAEARLSAEQIGLAVEFAEKSFMFREAGRKLVLLRDQLIPKATESLEVARIGYLSGQLDFFNLSDAQRTLLMFELDEVEALTRRETALTELSLLILGVFPANAPLRPAAATTEVGSARPKIGGTK
jgi:outer membrane protein TolC